jgi:hypothetical protein
LQALEQVQGSGFLVGTQTGVDFGDVDRTACQEMPLVQEFLQQLTPIPLAVDGVDNDASVE